MKNILAKNVFAAIIVAVIAASLVAPAGAQTARMQSHPAQAQPEPTDQQTAEQGSQQKGGRGAIFLKKVTEALNLNVEQQQHLKKIISDVAEFRKQNMQSHKDDIEKFKEQFKSDKMDAEAMKTDAAARQGEREQMADFMRSKLIEFHDMLTPEQRSTAVEKFSGLIEGHFMGGAPDAPPGGGPGERTEE